MSFMPQQLVRRAIGWVLAPMWRRIGRMFTRSAETGARGLVSDCFCASCALASGVFGACGVFGTCYLADARCARWRCFDHTRCPDPHLDPRPEHIVHPSHQIHVATSPHLERVSGKLYSLSATGFTSQAGCQLPADQCGRSKLPPSLADQASIRSAWDATHVALSPWLSGVPPIAQDVASSSPAGNTGGGFEQSEDFDL